MPALLDLRTFVSRDFTTAIVLPFFMQDVLGHTPLTTGLILLPGWQGIPPSGGSPPRWRSRGALG